MDVKRKHKLCIEIYKTLNNLNPNFIKEIYYFAKYYDSKFLALVRGTFSKKFIHDQIKELIQNNKTSPRICSWFFHEKRCTCIG